MRRNAITTADLSPKARAKAEALAAAAALKSDALMRAMLAVSGKAKPSKRTPKPLRETEASFQRRVIALAQANGWRVAHFRKARTAKGWVTPVAADGKGFPDLVLVHPTRRRVLWWECKRDDGKTTDEQYVWLSDLVDAGERAAVVRPRDWGYIEATLTERRGGA